MARERLTVQGERKTSRYRGIWDCTRQIVKQARHLSSLVFQGKGVEARRLYVVSLLEVLCRPNSSCQGSQ